MKLGNPLLSTHDLSTIAPSHNSCNSDLNHPITIRKGVKSCTQHSISNFVSYGPVSLYINFLSSLHAIPIPER